MKNFNPKMGLFVALMAFALFSAFIARATGLPVAGVIAVLCITGLIAKPKGVALTTVSPDTTAIMNYIGKIRPALFMKLYNGLDIANDITLVPGVKNDLKLTKLVIKNGPKPYTGNFNPRGNDIGYSGQVLSVEQWQRDLIIDPRKYRTTYLSDFRAPGEGALNNTIPFAQYTVSGVLAQLAGTLNDTTAYFGLGKAAFTAYVAATTYAIGALVSYPDPLTQEVNYFKANQAVAANESPATASQKWDDANALAIAIGLGTRLKTARDNGTITNVVSTGDLNSTSGIYAQSKAVFRKLPDAIKNIGANLYMPISVWEGLADDFEDKVGKFTENDNSGIIYLANTNKKCRIVPTTWQHGSKQLIATTKENLLMGTDLLSDMNEINTIPDVYNLKMGLAGVLGFNFQDADALVINDQN
jgi:hypothetical protein